MTPGKIVKIVRSYGARWGMIQPLGTTREVFFNNASLPEGTNFPDLREGQVLEFDEEKDRANGTHAVRIVLGERPQTLDAQ